MQRYRILRGTLRVASLLVATTPAWAAGCLVTMAQQPPCPTTTSPTPSASAVRSSTAIGTQSAVVTQRPIGGSADTTAYTGGSQPTWSPHATRIAAWGLAATVVAMALDRSDNNYIQNHFSFNNRTRARHWADVMTWVPIGFAATTWFDSPWASARLARTSSVALTAGAVTTVEVFALKYAFGRERPGPNNDPFQFYPFSSRYQLSVGNGGFGNTASFPSGHAAIVWALVTPYAQTYSPWLYAIPVAVSAARVVSIDGHWLSDTVAAGFLGYLTANAVNRYFPESNYGILFFGKGVGLFGRF